MKKQTDNLRMARMIQWISGGAGWITICLVYRILVPLWRAVARAARQPFSKKDRPI